MERTKSLLLTLLANRTTDLCIFWKDNYIENSIHVSTLRKQTKVGNSVSQQ